jgi:hypothetical protein
MNVFKASFSEDLSTPPQLHAWDDYLMLTADHKIFKGTVLTGYSAGPPEVLGKPLIGGIGLTMPPAADWFPTAKVVGAAVDVASLLKGDEGFCQCSGVAPVAEEETFFNLDYKIPCDLLPADSIGHVISMEYQYTGAPPVIGWYANVGTEETPDWVLLFPGVEGSAPQPGMTVIRACDGGEGYNGTQTYKLTRPISGQKFPDEIWLMDYTV